MTLHLTPAVRWPLAAVKRIKLQVNVDREAAYFQAEALTSIQQSNASIQETNAAILAMFCTRACLTTLHLANNP